MKKKLYKDCDIVGAWMKSITNHMYWCAALAPDGDGIQMVTQWQSLMNHLCDQHDECYHLPLGDRRRKWFIPGNDDTIYVTEFTKRVLYTHSIF